MTRIVGWAKRHPKLASGLGGFVVLVVIAGIVGDPQATDTATAAAPSSVPTVASSTEFSTVTGEAPTSPSSPSAAELRTAQSSVTATSSTLSGTAATMSAAPATGLQPVAQSTTAIKQSSGDTALALLAALTVKGKAPMTGYDRAGKFGPAWTDDVSVTLGHNGCRTRDDILQRDLTSITFKNSGHCTVAAGVLVDPYTGKTIQFVRGQDTSSAVQIDHVVALGNVWESGGQQMTQQQREQIANDPLNLLAVDGSTNERKGKSNAAEWLPPNKAYRCAYIARQIAVKAKYRLSVTQPEKDAMERVLATCPAVKAPTEGQKPPAVTARSTAAQFTSTPAPRTSTSIVTVPKTTASKATPTRISTPTKPASPRPQVVEFKNCTELREVYPNGVGRPGAVDHTSSGKKGNTSFFVNADLYQANTGRDGDKDGIACE